MSQHIARLVLCACTAIIATAAFAQNGNKLYYYNIDDKGGWQSCSACAGGLNSSSNYSGPVKVSYPSRDGSSAQFSIRNPWPSYANVLWWNDQLAGAADHSTIAGIYNMQYDLYYYIKQPQHSQALEFDVTQTICNDNPCTAASKSTRYTYGTECNRNSTGTWRVWSGSQWINTGVRCDMPSYTWNHLIWNFQRTSANQVRFISFTYNGRTYYVNCTFSPVAINAPADDFNADFQMDGDFRGHPYTTWIDTMNLTAW